MQALEMMYKHCRIPPEAPQILAPGEEVGSGRGASAGFAFVRNTSASAGHSGPPSATLAAPVGRRRSLLNTLGSRVGGPRTSGATGNMLSQMLARVASAAVSPNRPSDNGRESASQSGRTRIGSEATQSWMVLAEYPRSAPSINSDYGLPPRLSHPCKYFIAFQMVVLFYRLTAFSLQKKNGMNME